MTRYFLIAALAVGLMVPVGASAQQVFNESVEISNPADGLGIGRTPNGRPIRIRGGNGVNAINIENDALNNVFQMTVNASGDAFFRGRDGSNVEQFRFTANGNSFVKGGDFGVGAAPSGAATFEVTGTALVSGTATVQVLEITGGADLSEQFKVTGGEAAPGSVMCIDANRPGALVSSSKAYDRTVAGIVSGAGGVGTGMMMGHQGTIASGDHPIALTGRVYVKATDANGTIQPGDLLTTSDIAGHAMKVTDYTRAQGAIIGKAMTPVNADTGLVLVLVSLQ